jgi:5-methyltetrahydropteroyltriglutamate--homocysteine methyltransferase
VADVVRRQSAAGVNVVNDGEASKIGHSTYVKERLGTPSGILGITAS